MVPVFGIFQVGTLTKHEIDYTNTPKIKMMTNETVG